MNWLLAGAALDCTCCVCTWALGIIEGGAFERLPTPTDCAKVLFDFIVLVRKEGAVPDDDGEVTEEEGGGCSNPNGLTSLPPRPSVFDGREKRSDAVGEDENKFSALFVFTSL